MEVLWYGFVLAYALGMAAWFGLAMRIPAASIAGFGPSPGTPTRWHLTANL
jgi:hypothetical protein